MSNIIFILYLKDSYAMKEHKDGMLSKVDFNNIIEISIDSLKESV
mgnify:CR=1 FL=1